MTIYRVLREHDGDKFYREGDMREADAGDVAHLVEMGVLRLDGPDTSRKGEPPVRNKAAPPVQNKAQRPPATKARGAIGGDGADDQGGVPVTGDGAVTAPLGDPPQHSDTGGAK